MRATTALCRAYSAPVQDKAEKVYPMKDPGYMYVNAEPQDMSFKALSDKAAQTMFWTELARGFAVTFAYIFKVRLL